MTLAELHQWGRDHRDLLNKITSALIIGTIVIWLLWDGFVGWSGAQTESRQLTNWSQWVLSLPYAIASLLGHWWWPWRGEKSPYISKRAIINFAVLGFLVGWDVENWLVGTPDWLIFARRPEYWVAIGYPMGHLCWGQRSTEPLTKEAA